MSLKRILKLLAAFFTGQGVSIVTQLLIPPFFLHRYPHGVEVYGEWVVLTAAVSYLSTLNSGIQTYANNQMAIHYNGGELEEAKTMQASALKLSLALIAGVAVVGSTVLLMPVGHWLHLRYTASPAASATIFLLMLQLMTSWLFSLLCNSYMVLGRAHRGQNWNSAQRLAATLALAGFLWGRASFPVLALTQLVSMIVFTILVVADMRITAPVLLPSLRYGNMKTMKAILKPSAYFGLYSVSGFLVWQGPVLVIQLLLGPTVVAVFSFTRAMFNFSRQILSVATFAISQEITLLVGSRDWRALHRLYDLSERVVLFLVTTVSIGSLLMCPVAFSLWLHRRNFYEPGLCLLMAIMSAVMGIKDHKIQFQWSSNRHQKLAVISVLTYLGMCGLSAITLRPFGIEALIVLWVAAELIQVVAILQLNKKLFPREIHVSATPVVRALAMLAVCFSLVGWPVYRSEYWSLLRTTGIACAAVAILSVASYFFFGLNEVRRLIEARLRRRYAVVE
jgi:O-antigen/teichoic acid export membrane protein